MKSIKILFFCYISLFMLSIISCREDTTKLKSIRRIINETSYVVEINVYADNVNLKYQIGSMDTLNIDGFCVSGVESYCSLGWTSTLAFADIIFDSQWILSYVHLPDDPSIKSINADPTASNYGYQKSQSDGKNIYTYTITIQDFESAIPINE